MPLLRIFIENSEECIGNHLVLSHQTVSTLAQCAFGVALDGCSVQNILRIYVSLPLL